MTYFKLDIPKVNESISRYKDIKINCLEDINIAYSGLGYTESAWNDQNAYTFIETIKKDRYKLNEYFSYLDNLYNEINQFKTDIDTICNKQGYRANSIVFKFDDSQIEDCKQYLRDVIPLLNDSLNRININSFSADFEYINSVYKLRSEIRSAKTMVNNLLADIDNFVNSVNNEIYDSKFRMNKLGKYQFNIKTTDYIWNTTTPNTKVSKAELPKLEGIRSNSINIDIKGNRDINVSNNITNYSINNNTIDLKEENISNVNKNINQYDINNNKMNFKEIEEINRLNSNLKEYSTLENKVNLEDPSDIRNLKRDASEFLIHDNHINFEAEKQDSYVKEGTREFDINTNKIDLNNLGKDQYDLSKNIIDYSKIDNDVHIDSNIQ